MKNIAPATGQPHILLTILVGIASVTYLTFFFPIFVTSDIVRYAIGFNSLQQPGAELFNYEMSFGYYLLVHTLVEQWPTLNSPQFINGLGVVASLGLLVWLYKLMHSLTSAPVAFLACLYLLFSPGFWLLSRSGHPAIIGLSLFFAGVAVFNYAVDRQLPLWSIVLIINLLVAALLIRVDLVLLLLLPVALLIYKQQWNTRLLYKICLLYSLTVGMYLGLRWWLLDYMVDPTEGTIQNHMESRLLNLPYTFLSIFRNIGLFAFSALPLMVFYWVLAISWLIIKRQWRMLTLITAWMVPYSIFLPFWGMDYARLSVPALPAAMLVINYWLDHVSRGYVKYALIIASLVVAHLMTFVTAPLLARSFPFTIHYKEFPVSAVPIQFVALDYLFRKDYLASQNEKARVITEQARQNMVIVVDSPHTPWYVYHIQVQHQTICQHQPYQIPYVTLRVCPTPENTFYLFELTYRSPPGVISQILSSDLSYNSRFYFQTFRPVPLPPELRVE